MKITRLDLIAFGPFTKTSFDLGHENNGLHLIYGANEAGKSSALRAIQAWLFGIHSRTDDNFIHENKALRVGGELENAAGQTLAFVRRKGSKNDVLDPEGGAALPSSVLEPFLGGMDRDAFDRIWSIDHEKLIVGGHQLQTLQGLAGESLFAAAMGVTGLSQALTKLEDDGQAIFQPDRRPKTEVRDATKKHQGAVKRKRDSEVSASAWTKLQKRLTAARANHEKVRGELGDLRREAYRLDRILLAMEDIGERQAIKADLAEVEMVVVLPSDYTAEARRQTQADLAKFAEQLEDTKARLDGPEGLVARRADLDVDDGLLADEPAIVTLQQKAGAYKKACVDLPKRDGEKRLLVEQAKQLLEEISPGLGWDDAEKLRLTQTVVAEVGRLGQQEGSLRQSLSTIEGQITELQIELKRSRGALEELPASLDMMPLQRAVKQAGKHGDLETLASEKDGEIERLGKRVDSEIKRLGHWQGTGEQVDQLRLPLRATVEEYAERFRELKEEKSGLDQEVRNKEQELERTSDEIEANQRQRRIPSRAMLAEERARRDAGWQLVRSTWQGDKPTQDDLDAFAGAQELPVAYEHAVAVADGTADQLIEDSELSATLEQQRHQCRALEEVLLALKAQQEAWGADHEALEAQWQSEWTQGGVEAPRSPKEMAEWLEGFGEVRRLTSQLRAAKEEAVKYSASLKEHGVRLSGCLSAMGLADDLDDDSFGGILARCQELLDQRATGEQERKHLTGAVAEKEDKLKGAEGKLKGAKEELVTWQGRWSASVVSLGSEADLSIGQATDRVQIIRDYFDRRNAIAELEAKRIGPMQADKVQFEAEVAALVERCGSDLAGQPPAVTTDALVKRLKDAEKGARDRFNLEQQITEKRQEVERLEDEAERAGVRLQKLCSLAGVSEANELMGIEETSDRKRKLQVRLTEIDGRLLKVSEGGTVEDLVEETAGKSSDDLKVVRGELVEKITAAEATRDGLIAEVTTLEGESNAIDGSADAQAADQEALGWVAFVAEKAEEYVRLRLASNLLRRRIEKHRTENQDPMIARASELFARLTCGSFSGLTLDYDDKEQPTIVGVREEEGDRLLVENFSKGAADQLYLALRLAYLQARLQSGEPMPIILDDILVDFDDDRAAAALKVLAEMSEQTQIILLTHHAHVRALAKETLPDQVLKEHALEEPA